jgi:serine/threonine-protein kinase
MLNSGTQFGPYEIQQLLGRGGMAEVYQAWQPNLGRHEALKVLSSEMAGNRAFVERFLAEPKRVAGLQHQNIATVYTVSDAGAPQPYFTMEMVEGGDLAELIRARGRLPLEEALPMLRQIASALDFAHNHGLIHRDIKPANILLKRDGGGYIVKVVDFGISKAIEDTGSRLTQTGMFIGTPEYMSPEQAGSGAPVDQRTDQYSLAVLAYEMLCGVPPFRQQGNTSMMSVMMKHVREEPLPPSRYNLSLPAAADTAILRALAKNPAHRFASCGQFVEALAQPVSPPISPPVLQGEQRIMANEKRQTTPWVPILVGVAAFAGAALIGVGLTHPSTQAETHLVESPGEGTVPPPPTPADVEIPNVQNILESQAREMAKAKGLGIDVTTGRSYQVSAGRVMSQFPRAGTAASAGSTLRVRISTGPGRQFVPHRQLPPSPPSGYWPSAGAPQYTVPLTYGDLYGKSAWDLDVMRNTIYARYGRSFHRLDLQNYFNSQSWYRYNPNFQESMLTDVERRNAAFILKYQKGGG